MAVAGGLSLLAVSCVQHSVVTASDSKGEALSLHLGNGGITEISIGKYALPLTGPGGFVLSE